MNLERVFSFNEARNIGLGISKPLADEGVVRSCADLSPDILDNFGSSLGGTIRSIKDEPVLVREGHGAVSSGISCKEMREFSVNLQLIFHFHNSAVDTCGFDDFRFDTDADSGCRVLIGGVPDGEFEFVIAWEKRAGIC